MDGSILLRKWKNDANGAHDEKCVVVISWNVCPSQYLSIYLRGTVQCTDWGATLQVLAQCNMPGHVAFSKTPRKVLKMEHRLPYIVNYLCSFAAPHQPDILCLQGVDRYKKFYREQLLKLGYDGQVYKQRPSRTEKWKDGCLVAFRKSCFELVETDHLEFNDLAEVADELGLDAEYLVRNNVAAVCVLRDRRDGNLFLAASVHLFWEPRCADIKLLQAATILRRVNDVVTRHPKVHAVVVSGDFNSTPNCATFSLLTTGKLDLSSGDCAKLPPAVLNYIHNVLIDCTTVPCLHSAYSVGDIGKTGVISTFTVKYSGLIDFILYSTTI